MFYLWAVIDAVVYIRNNNKNRTMAIAILIVLSCVVFVFAWGVSNTGTATRHREKMVIIFGLLWAICHDGSRDKQIRIGNIVLL